MSDAPPGKNKDRFSRIFDVLELLAAHSGGMTATEISKRLELPLSSMHNLLQRLLSFEAVVVTDDHRYLIGGRAVRYGIRIVRGLQVGVVARRHLEDLAQLTGEDVYLAERFGKRVIYTDRVPGHSPVTIDIRLGQPLFLHATSVGKLFAAHHKDLRDEMLAGPRHALTPSTITDEGELSVELDQICAQGFSVSNEEAISGIVSIAVPVMDADNQLVAAIHLSALGGPTHQAPRPGWLEHTAATARAIERDLGRLSDAVPSDVRVSP